MAKNTNKKNIIKLQIYLNKLEKEKNKVIDGSRMDNCNVHGDLDARNDSGQLGRTKR